MNGAADELRRPRCYLAAVLVGGGAWWAGLPWFAAVAIAFLAFGAGVITAIWTSGGTSRPAAPPRVASEPTPASRPQEPGAEPGVEPGVLTFLSEGEYWTIGPADALFRLHDAKGLRYIHQLLATPGQERHVLDLVTEGRPAHAPALAGREDVSAPAPPEPILDRQAREAYRQRIEDLRDQLKEAEVNGDAERASRAREELEFISDELHRQTRPDGSSRTVSDETERARVNVSRAIRASIAKIADQDPSLGHHLDHDIRTGTYCSYVPDPAAAPLWRL